MLFITENKTDKTEQIFIGFSFTSDTNTHLFIPTTETVEHRECAEEEEEEE